MLGIVIFLKITGYFKQQDQSKLFLNLKQQEIELKDILKTRQYTIQRHIMYFNRINNSLILHFDKTKSW